MAYMAKKREENQKAEDRFAPIETEMEEEEKEMFALQEEVMEKMGLSRDGKECR